EPHTPNGKREQQRRARDERRRAHLLGYVRHERKQAREKARLFVEVRKRTLGRLALLFVGSDLRQDDPAPRARSRQCLLRGHRRMRALGTTIVVKFGRHSSNSSAHVQGVRSAKRFRLKNGINSMPAMKPPMCARKATPPCPAGVRSWLNNCKP